MSLSLILQNKDNIFISSDSAISGIHNSKLHRLHENGEKIFHIDNQIIFIAGKTEIVNAIIKEYLNSEIRSINRLCEIVKVIVTLFKERVKKLQMKAEENFLFDLLLVQNGNKKPELFNIDKDYNIIKLDPPENGIKIYVAGMDTENIAYQANDYINQKYKIEDIYTKIYDSVSNEGIGGNLKVFWVNKDGIRLLLKSKIKEKENLCRLNNYHELNLLNTYYIITSNQFTMTNTGGTFEVNGISMKAENMDLTLKTGLNEIYLNPTARFQIKKNGNLVYYLDSNGNVVHEGIYKSGATGSRLKLIMKNLLSRGNSTYCQMEVNLLINNG